MWETKYQRKNYAHFNSAIVTIYHILKSSEMNFLSVTTRVTVRLAHSLVRTKTAEMQRYCVRTLQAR